MEEAAVILVENKYGEYLLLQRTKDPNGWCLPGGKLDKGEASHVAAARELLEETGLSVYYEDLTYYGKSKSQNGRTIHLFYSRGWDKGDNVILSPKEHTGYMWLHKKVNIQE